MNVNEIVKLALEEDLRHSDITTDNLDLNPKSINAFLIAKESGILSGIDIAYQCFKTIDRSINFVNYKKDGDSLQTKEEIAKITGPSFSILKAERVALNFLQRMSGIATMTNKFVNKIEPYRVKLLDTRKTTPLLRELEKYSVKIGGGFNHRFGLYDMIMLKENHIRAAGSITKAVETIKKHDCIHKIEVEVTNLEELEEAVKAKADRIMLDNMSINEIKEAVKNYGDKVELEASGNINLDTIRNVAETGVHFISSGAITHSYTSLDISLLFKE